MPYGPRRPNRNIIKDFRTAIRNAVPFCLLGAPTANMSRKEQVVLENYLKEKFHLWADSWITPLIDEAEQRLVKPKKKSEHQSVPEQP